MGIFSFINTKGTTHFLNSIKYFKFPLVTLHSWSTDALLKCQCIATNHFAHIVQRQQTVLINVRTRHTFVGLKCGWGLTCICAHRMCSRSCLQFTSTLLLAIASYQSNSNHLSSRKLSLPQSMIPGVGNLATYDQFLLHMLENLKFFMLKLLHKLPNSQTP